MVSKTPNRFNTDVKTLKKSLKKNKYTTNNHKKSSIYQHYNV